MVLLCVVVLVCLFVSFFFFFKQKTAYEMRISDWSSDVCSSDLQGQDRRGAQGAHAGHGEDARQAVDDVADLDRDEGVAHLKVVEFRLPDAVAVADGEGLQDRKSTRLNSSH